MTKLFRKNVLVVSIFCALLEMSVSPTIVYASGMALEYDATQGDIVGNKYSITEPISSLVYKVFAALHNGGGNVSENTLSVVKDLSWDTSVSTTIPPMLAAGYTELGIASTNVLNVENTDIYDTIGGANKKGGSAINNRVYIGHNVQAGAWGDKTYALVVGGAVITPTNSSVAQGNTVTVNATNSLGSEDFYIDYVLGGQTRGSSGDCVANTVYLERGHIYLLYGAESSGGDAKGNQVFIDGGLVSNRNQNGYGGVNGGNASKSALENVVSITRGKVNAYVYGGTGSLKANENKVLISGGEIVGSVWGGSSDDEAKGNLVEIEGNPNLTAASLFGGDAPISLNNTLSIKTSGLVVQQIGDFQNLNFDVAQAVGSTPLLKVIGNQATNIKNTIVKVTLDKNAIPLQKGQEIILLKNDQTIATDGLQGSIDYENPEGLLDYGLSLKVTEMTLGVLVSSVETKPETKSIVSANLSRIAFVNQGSDLLVSQGIVAGREAEEKDRHLFVALQTGSNHYNIDSYIDLEGESVLVGSVWPVEAFGSKLSLGGFIESGWGDYEVENALTAQSAIKGQGETHYRGGGLLAYWSESPLAEQGLYAEASMRLGRADISYQSVASSLDVNYDVKGTYWAGHVGLGYRHQFNDENHADLYTKFFYSHQDSDAFVIDRNTVQMDTVESMRWRTGLSYRHRGFTPEGCVFDWQAALAYEYEFDGKAKGSIDGYRILESELQGSTGIGEVSITFLPSSDSLTRVRASLQGFVGAREGYIGQIQWTQTF